MCCCRIHSSFSSLIFHDMQIFVGSTANSTSGALIFTPNSIQATEGSVITFNFSGVPGNHTVAQSSFANPCQPLAGGFDSGYIQIPVLPSSASDFPTWNLTVTNASARKLHLM